MPELPDVELYRHALGKFIVGRAIESVAVRSPFVVRTFEPPIETIEGRKVLDTRRLGKRIVWQLEGDLYLVVHLMIAGRFHWRKVGARPASKADLAAFRFEHGTLMLTEASPKKRAGLWLVEGEAAALEHDPGGMEVLTGTPQEFSQQLRSENRTLKRALTNPKKFSGIGNAYSDEILHAAGLSPVQLTKNLDDDEIERLFEQTRQVMTTWTDRLKKQTGEKFPEKVTAFRPEMAVHGKFGAPCPVCGTAVQRIIRAENEVNYCPRCQTGGKVLKDRGLSRLLKDDWPSSVEDWEEG